MPDNPPAPEPPPPPSPFGPGPRFSQFDAEVTFPTLKLEGIRAVADEFTVKGDLGQAEGPGAPQQPQPRDLSVFVSIWQTEEDTEGGSAQVIVGHALGVGEQVPDQLGKWSARLVVRDGAFMLGRPATGLGLIVENTGDPNGFETYTWTQRLQIGKQTL